MCCHEKPINLPDSPTRCPLTTDFIYRRHSVLLTATCLQCDLLSQDRSRRTKITHRVIDGVTTVYYMAHQTASHSLTLSTTINRLIARNVHTSACCSTADVSRLEVCARYERHHNGFRVKLQISDLGTIVDKKFGHKHIRVLHPPFVYLACSSRSEFLHIMREKLFVERNINHFIMSTTTWDSGRER